MGGDQSRLRWRCRRGIREMDILLQRFIDECYPALTEDEQGLFEQLLEETDLDILAWIMGKSAPDNPAYGKLIQALQNLSPSPGLN